MERLGPEITKSVDGVRSAQGLKYLLFQLQPSLGRYHHELLRLCP